MMPLQRRDVMYPWRWKCGSLFYEGKLLLVDEVREALEEYAAREQRKPTMLSKFRNADQHFFELMHIYRSLAPWRIPVSRLRHVTIKDNFLKILREEGFRGSELTFVLNGEPTDLRVSCWGVDVPLENIEYAKKIRVQEFRDKLSQDYVDTCHLSGKDCDEVRDMMVNSPAFSQRSRYGNFQFSFPIDDLLEEYRTQHCRGGRPVLRVLGTQTYKLEIVHWVLIHSPHCRDFTHLPKVHRRRPLYWDGNQLMWEPESVTDQFTWYISNATGALKKKPLTGGTDGSFQTYDPWVWNNPVFAFHLPENRALEMARTSLLQNVQACESMDFFDKNRSRILRHPKRKYLPKHEAERFICQEKSY